MLMHMSLVVGFVVAIAAATAEQERETCSGLVPVRHRDRSVSITDFGGVGDGTTVNTKAFRNAIFRCRQLSRSGGTTLYIPPGVFLTGSFNLSSHMTLYLARGAVIRAIQDTKTWPLISPLPSYGRGREHPGSRYISLIHGNGLRDVVITGDNGTIDGQGEIWWNMWRQGTLQFTRPHLIELVNSKNILISNLTFINSPFWNIHPVYCNKVVIRFVTVVAPANSPNTDGIDPDSSSNVCIEDSYISTGDDLVAVKSGWDEYGIAYSKPSTNITIRRITGSSPFAGIAIGSETSGGVENILAESINLDNMGVGIHVKTNIGRGGFIRNITISGVNIGRARQGVKIAGNVGDHPDSNYNPDALPLVEIITLKDLRGEVLHQPGLLHGLKGAPFTGICLNNISFTINGVPDRPLKPWSCSDVAGVAVKVSPWNGCTDLISSSPTSSCHVEQCKGISGSIYF